MLNYVIEDLIEYVSFLKYNWAFILTCLKATYLIPVKLNILIIPNARYFGNYSLICNYLYFRNSFTYALQTYLIINILPTQKGCLDQKNSHPNWLTSIWNTHLLSFIKGLKGTHSIFCRANKDTSIGTERWTIDEICSSKKQES